MSRYLAVLFATLPFSLSEADVRNWAQGISFSGGGAIRIAETHRH